MADEAMADDAATVPAPRAVEATATPCDVEAAAAAGMCAATTSDDGGHDSSDDEPTSPTDNAHAGGRGGRRNGAGRPDGTRGTRHARLIDRMPCRARAVTLPEPYRVLVNVDTCHSIRLADGTPALPNGAPAPAAKPWWKEPTKEDRRVFEHIQQHTVTSFGQHEKAHPINAFEQVIT